VVELDNGGMNLTARQFEKLVGRLQGRPADPTFWAVNVRDLARGVCGIAKEDPGLVRFAVTCLKAAAQRDRQIRCGNKSCPLLGSEPFPVNVFSNGSLRNSYLLDPANGRIAGSTAPAIPDGPAELAEPDPLPSVVQLNHDVTSVFTSSQKHIGQERSVKPEEVSLPDSVIEIHPVLERALRNVLCTEYNLPVVPQTVTARFIETHTDFRFLPLRNDGILVPADGMTLDITGWAYHAAEIRARSLADMTGFTIGETTRRLPFVRPLVRDICLDTDKTAQIARYRDLLQMYNLGSGKVT
jgi:hypothetical protein